MNWNQLLHFHKMVSHIQRLSVYFVLYICKNYKFCNFCFWFNLYDYNKNYKICNFCLTCCSAVFYVCSCSVLTKTKITNFVIFVIGTISLLKKICFCAVLFVLFYVRIHFRMEQKLQIVLFLYLGTVCWIARNMYMVS